MISKFFKNKKGDVPIILLVLGVLAICGLAILSFLVSGTGILKSSVNPGLSVFEDIYAVEEKVYFYKNINYDGLSPGEIEGLFETSSLEIEIEGDSLKINGIRKNIEVEYLSVP